MKKATAGPDDEAVQPEETSAAPTMGGLRYVGQEYIIGVPARDLTPDEARKFAAQIQATFQATGRVLYE